MKQYLLLFIIGGISLVSCDIINPSEGTPFFVEVPAIKLCTNDSCYDQALKRGTNSHAIVDAWVFADDNLLGAFELPARVPVLKSGNVKISVQGGIKSNGIISDAQQYDFFEPYSIYVDGVPGSTVVVNPTVTYRNSLFYWIENFDLENAGIKMEKYPSSDTVVFVTLDSTEVFEGKGSGKVVLSDGQSLFQGLSSTKFIFPHGQVIYAEINYKCNNAFTVGIRTLYNGFQNIGTALTLKPSYDNTSGQLVWKKVYVDLSYAIGLETAGYPQQLYLEMVKEVGGNAELYLDNIKIIHGI